VQRRYGVTLDPATQVLPVNGSREALFAWRRRWSTRRGPAPPWSAPTRSIRSTKARPCSPAPQTAFANSDPARNFAADWSAIDDATWARTQLLYVCSPGNPTGAVMPLDGMGSAVRAERPPRLRDRQRRVLLGDLLPRRAAAGRRCRRRARSAATTSATWWCLTSLSKRSNVPGMRSGFVAGDARS
jgi:N-succinyldiaminopimelate aminotransferase